MAKLATTDIYGDLRVKGITNSESDIYEKGRTLEDKYGRREALEAVESLASSTDETVSNLGNLSVINKNNSASHYLRGDGAWVLHGDLIGLSKNNSESHFLRGDGIWVGMTNNLTTDSSTTPLTAAQGKILHDNKLDKTATAPNSTKWSGYTFSEIFDYSSTYGKLVGKGGYIRTPVSGILPEASGGSGNVGTAAWPFSRIYGNTIYEGGSSLSSKYLARSGGAMTGPIQYTGSKATYTMIDFINNTGDANGNGIVIGGGGATIIGGGESGAAYKAAIGVNNGGSEILALCNDSTVTINPNMQSGYANKKTTTFQTNGHIDTPIGRVWTNGNQGAGSGMDADTVDGVHASGFIRRSGAWVSLSHLNQNTYYPVTTSLAASEYTEIQVVVGLNSGTKPAWSTHDRGFTTFLHLIAKGSGWGTSDGRAIILEENFRFSEDNPVGGTSQMSNSSTFVLWLRGGGSYYIYSSPDKSWTIRTSTYTASDQSVAPRTSRPGHSGVHDHVAKVGINAYPAASKGNIRFDV